MTENRKLKFYDSYKYRIGMALSLVAATAHFINKLKSKELLEVIALGIPISLLAFTLFVKFELFKNNHLKGIGGITFAVSILMWKRIHAYSVTVEALLMFVLIMTGLLLSFKYSGAEWDGRSNNQ